MSEEKEVIEVAEESTKKKFQLTPKAKKIVNVVVDVVCGAVLLFALILAVFTIRSKTKGYPNYTEIFGTAYLAVESNSMAAEMPDWVPEGKILGFKKGDLIKIKTLSAKEASELEVGDVITFKVSGITQNGKYVLNTHRIKAVNNDNGVITYTTQGDNNPGEDSTKVEISNIVGLYKGKASGIGKVFLFMNSSAGFFVCIVTPTLIVVVYCIVNLILVIRREKKAQVAAANEEKESEDERIRAERERIRAELLAEMQGGTASDVNQEQIGEPQSSKEAEPQPEAVVVADEVVENKEEKAEDPVEEKAEEVKAEEKTEEVKEVAVEEKAEKAEAAEKKPAAKKATPAKTTAKSSTAKTAAKPAASKSTGAKTATKSTATKAAGTKTASKPATTKSTGTKTAAKNTKKDSSEN